MRKFLAATFVIAAAGTAQAGPIDDAMRKIGTAYMCGPTFEYNEALEALRNEMLKAGVPDVLAGYSVSGIDEFVRREHAAKRASITKEECAAKYGRMASR